MITLNGLIPKISLNWTNFFFLSQKNAFPLKISKRYFLQTSWDKGLKKIFFQ